MLVVDDDRIFAEAIASVLRILCDRVVIAETLDGAMVGLQLARFHLVLLDLSLPDSDIPKTLATIPNMVATGARVVVLTGATINPAIEETARDAGAETIISKACGDSFIDRIRSLVGGKPRVADLGLRARRDR